MNFRLVAAQLGADIQNMGDLEVWQYIQRAQGKEPIQV